MRTQSKRLIRSEADSYPKQRLAAVLVLLHLDKHGELAVTLTTRSSKLRSHPGETSLPGGRWEEGDGEGGEWTAVGRFAHLAILYTADRCRSIVTRGLRRNRATAAAPARAGRL